SRVADDVRVRAVHVDLGPRKEPPLPAAAASRCRSVRLDPPLERLFAGLRERGLLRTDVELPLLVQVFKTCQLGLTALWAVEGPPWTGTQQVIDEQIRLFCRGLAPR